MLVSDARKQACRVALAWDCAVLRTAVRELGRSKQLTPRGQADGIFKALRCRVRNSQEALDAEAAVEALHGPVSRVGDELRAATSGED